MQEQEVEVFFCDLCGASVPEADLQGGAAVKHEGKTVGACCLKALRATAGAEPAASQKPAAAADTAAKPAAANENGRLLTVGVVLLAAVAGAVLFLDNRLSRLEKALETGQSEAASKRQSDSDVLMGVDVKLAGAARREDLQAATNKITEVATALDLLRGNTGQRIESVQNDLATMRGELRKVVDQSVDYRPLFEDLRDRHQRALVAIEAMRAAAIAQPVVQVPEPVVEEATSKPLDDLSPELAEQVRKLTAADPAVRFEAVDMLGASKDPKVLPHLLPLAKDPDAFVRRLTIEMLREFKSVESVEALLAGLVDDDSYVRDTAWRSLKIVTDQKFAFEPDGSKESRKRQVRKWTDWWESAKATFAP